jgi:uncharacterized Tic20 family protein
MLIHKNSYQTVRIWGTLCHLSSWAWIPIGYLVSKCIPLEIFLSVNIPFVIPLYIPGLNIIGPLMIWRKKKGLHPLLDAQCKEALNFQLSVMSYAIALGIICGFVFVSICGSISLLFEFWTDEVFSIGLFILFVIFTLLSAAMLIFQVLFVLIATIAALIIKVYRYPFTNRYYK